MPRIILGLLLVVAVIGELTNLQAGGNIQIGQKKFISIKPNKEEKIRLSRKSQKYLTFDLPEKEEGILVDITVRGIVHLCVLGSNFECLKDRQTFNKRQNQMLLSSSDLTYGIKIWNPSLQFKAKVKISYHNVVEDMCHTLETQKLHRKELTHSNCFEFDLSRAQDGELMISKQVFMNLQYEFSLCDKKLEKQDTQLGEYFFPKNLIVDQCQGKAIKTLKVVITDEDKDGLKTTKTERGSNAVVTIAYQYIDMPVMLLDGIGYTTTFPIDKKRIFQYELLDKHNLSIKVDSKSIVEIYVKIVEENEMKGVVPSSSNNHFSSKGGYIFTYFMPYLIITEQNLKKFTCQTCYLVITVGFKEGKDSIFTIEVTQTLTILSNGQIKHHFLPTGATAFYQYVPKIDTLVTYELSDNNKECAIVYLGKQAMPGSTKSLTKFQTNTIYPSKAGQAYYLTVKANEDCIYSLVATDSSNEVVSLEVGTFGALELEKDQVKYFLIRNQGMVFFKLLSLHVYGRVEIYLNSTTLENVKNFSREKTNYKDFQMKGQYMNRLVTSFKDKIFRKGRYYIVAVVAQKLTKSTLFFGIESTPLPIRDKIINDIMLQEGQVIQGEYYGNPKFQLQSKVHRGKLKILIRRSKQSFEAEYSEVDTLDKKIVDLAASSESVTQFIHSIFVAQPIIVSFMAEKNNTIYSLRFKQIDEDYVKYGEHRAIEDHSLQKQNKTRQNNSKQKQTSMKIDHIDLDAGQSQFINISNFSQVCISGYLRDKTQKILFSCNNNQSYLLKELTLVLTGDQKKLDFKTTILQNILTLQFPSLANYAITVGVKYNLCVSSQSNSTLGLAVMQSQDFSLLPAQVDTIVTNEYTFVTHTQSALIVDIFECRGKSSIVYEDERNKLDKKSTKKLDIVGLNNQPHAVRINRLNTTFYKVKAELAIMRWFPLDIDQGIGTGYMDYSVGSLKYQNGVFGVTLAWEGLARGSDVDSSITQISYTLYISSKQEELQSGSQCQNFLQGNTWQLPHVVDSTDATKVNQTFSYQISKSSLITRFGANVTLFGTVVIDLLLSPLGQREVFSGAERYRFIYPSVQIPGQLLVANFVTSMSMPQKTTAAFILIASVVIVLYVCLRKILPMLGLLKNRYLVEQNDQLVFFPQENNNDKVGTEAQQDLVVPPSSERGAVNRYNQMIDQMEQQQQLPK